MFQASKNFSTESNQIKPQTTTQTHTPTQAPHTKQVKEAEQMTNSPEQSEQQQQQQHQKQQHQQNASSLAAQTNENNEAQQVNKQPQENDAQTAPTPPADQPKEIKQFSEKSLQELADYYLNLEPADIPDTGLVVSGIAGRFPNADNLNELWENLLNGRDMVLGPDDKRWPLGKCFFRSSTCNLNFPSVQYSFSPCFLLFFPKKNPNLYQLFCYIIL